MDQAPIFGDLGVANAKRVKPGIAAASILYLRMDNLSEFRMPPIGTSVKDTAGLALIASWINGLPNPLRPGAPGSLRVIP